MLEPGTGAWSIETELTLGCSLADWTAESSTQVENGDWKHQDFELVGRIGDVSIETDLRFEPYKHRFRNWIAEFEWEVEDLTLTLTTKLTRTTDWLIFEFEEERDALDVEASYRLRAPSGSCHLAFYDADLSFAFAWCGIDTNVEIAMDSDGFDEFVLELEDLIHPRVPWAAFDLEIARSSTTTTFEISPGLELTSTWCATCLDLTLEGTLPNTPSLFPLSISEVKLEVEIADWEIEATVLGDPADWIDGVYWLELEAETELDLGPCGELSLGLNALWTESQIGELTWRLVLEPNEGVSLGLSVVLDCIIRSIDTLEVLVDIGW